jgi:hypothetical protein
MNILITILVFLLGLIFSGLLYMFGIVQLTPVPYNIWLLVSIGLFFVAYKIRFKNKRVLKFYLFRKWIEFNSWFYKIDKKMTLGHRELNNMQSKAVKLWKLCLKDKNCNLQCSISNKQRQVESGKILIILSPDGVDHSIMSIFDHVDNNKCNFYEIVIPQPHLEEICQQFDDLVLKRMGNKEQKNRGMVEEFFDTMVSRQEKLVGNS